MSALLHGCLPDTEYFAITATSGRTYGVWVTTPPGYAETDAPMPLIYVMDGNFAVGLTAPLIVTASDPFLTIAPYIQVSVGYAGDEAANWATLRNRDLVPPGEPLSEEVVGAMETARDSGAVTQAQVDAYLQELRGTRADLFLDFLVNELHREIQSRFRVSDTGHGLFGYSYGGLFALYAWLSDAGLFATVGAGSPGVATPDSRVFELLSALPERDDPRLHVTVNEAELIGDIPVYRATSRFSLAFVEALHRQGRSATLTREMLHGTHVTGLQASFLSFLKACHVR
ncbi:MAG: alpha/beta hydrolase-fold protein [Actinomycetota bacterium]|nr:alpha/beta hydrolase-fold protein [Actinomycetota bacterium]